MHGWPIAAALLAVVAFVLLALKPSRWHFVAGALASLAAPLAASVAWLFVPRPVGDDGSVFAVFPAIQFPYEPIGLTVAFSTLALALAVTTLVAKRDLRLRIAASVILPLAIDPLVRSVMCGRAYRVAIDDLANVHEVPVVDASDWPKGVHAGQPFAIHTELAPAVPRSGFLGFGGRRIDAREWQTLASYTATAPGTESVTLTAARGPVRVERKKDLVVFRDEGPSWLPLALGNTWTLTAVHGKPNKIGAVESAFEKDAPDPKGAVKVLRVEREIFGGGLHEYVLELTDGGSTTEATVYRRDGELVLAAGDTTLAAGDFPLLGECRYATAPIDDARTLAGPTVCGFATDEEHYGHRGVVGSLLQVFTLGLIDTRPTRSVERGFVLVRSGRG